MSEQKTLFVSRTDIIKAGYEQYMESEGGSHALQINKNNELVYKPGTSYYLDDSISAYELCNILEFKNLNNISNEDNLQNTVKHIEVKEEVTINETTYKLNINTI